MVTLFFLLALVDFWVQRVIHIAPLQLFARKFGITFYSPSLTHSIALNDDHYAINFPTIIVHHSCALTRDQREYYGINPNASLINLAVRDRI